MRRVAAWFGLAALVVAPPVAVVLVGGGDDGEHAPPRSAAPSRAGGGDRAGPQREARPSRRDRSRGDDRAARRPRPGPGGKSAVEAVEAELGDRTPGGEPTVIASACRRGTCYARFRSAPRGRGVVLRRSEKIARTLFAIRGVRRVVLYAHHQTVGRNKDERAAFLAFECTGSASRCRDRHQAGGRQRSLMRRGRLSAQDARQARGR